MPKRCGLVYGNQSSSNWRACRAITENIIEEITELKRLSDQDFGSIGSGVLLRSILREGLLDELTGLIHPLILGRGKRLFEDSSKRGELDLLELNTFSTGVISHVSVRMNRQ